MSLSEIIQKISVYFVPAAIAAIVLIIAGGAYIMLQHKKNEEARPLTRWRKPLLGLLLACYMVVVFGLTGLSRPANYTGDVNLHLFSGYVEAWNSYSLYSFQLIVFNIVMFIPLGILLPLLHDKLGRFRWLFIAALGTTLLIETVQFATGRGIFELDDLFHNTLGGIIGYHLYQLAARVMRERKVRLAEAVKRLALPAAIAIFFGGMHLVYIQQEFGNMSIHPVYGTDMSGVTVSTKLHLSQEPSSAPVYKNRHSLNRERGRETVRLLQKKLGLPPIAREVRDGANQQFLFEEAGGTRYILTYFILDGSWGLFDDRYHPEEHPAAGTDNDNQALAEKIMKDLGLLPPGTQVTFTENGDYDWRLPKEAYGPHNRWDGYTIMTLKSNGQIYSINYGFTPNDYVRDVPIMAPAEAFDQIRKGRFDEINPFRPGDKLVINACGLSYVYDTKGYYQPVYTFEGTVNGETPWFRQIDARP